MAPCAGARRVVVAVPSVAVVVSAVSVVAAAVAAVTVVGAVVAAAVAIAVVAAVSAVIVAVSALTVVVVAAAVVAVAAPRRAVELVLVVIMASFGRHDGVRVALRPVAPRLVALGRLAVVEDVVHLGVQRVQVVGVVVVPVVAPAVGRRDETELGRAAALALAALAVAVARAVEALAVVPPVAVPRAIEVVVVAAPLAALAAPRLVVLLVAAFLPAFLAALVARLVEAVLMVVAAFLAALRGTIIKVVEVVAVGVLVEGPVLVLGAADRLLALRRGRGLPARLPLVIHQTLEALDPGLSRQRRSRARHNSATVLDDEERRPRVAHGLDVPQEQPAARLGVGLPYNNRAPASARRPAAARSPRPGRSASASVPANSASCPPSSGSR